VSRRQEVVSRERGLYKNGRLWWKRTVRAPLLGTTRSLSTGTADLRRANAISRLIDMFMDDARHEHHEWLSRAVRGEVSLEDIYLHHAAGELHMFKLQLEAAKEPDLDLLAGQWITTHLPTLDIGARSKTEYARHIRYFIPEGRVMPTSELTSDYVQTKLAGVTGARHDRNVAANSSTRRQYLSSLRQFLRWVRRKLPRLPDPLAGVVTPKKAPSRMTYHEYPKVRAVLDRVENAEHRAALALLYGSGMEMVALEAMRGEHVGTPAERTVVAMGTKNAHRESRTIFVDQWAWAIFYEHARTKLPKAPLWTFSSWELRNAFYQAQVAAGLVEKPARTADGNLNWSAVKPHTLHDCRHSYYINRALGLDGEPARDTSYLSAQLGHADDTTGLRIYKKLNIAERLRLSQAGLTAKALAPVLLGLA
jgi:integrase